MSQNAHVASPPTSCGASRVAIDAVVGMAHLVEAMHVNIARLPGCAASGASRAGAASIARPGPSQRAPGRRRGGEGCWTHGARAAGSPASEPTTSSLRSPTPSWPWSMACWADILPLPTARRRFGCGWGAKGARWRWSEARSPRPAHRLLPDCRRWCTAW
ncbi:MAG: hypothetical protein MZW92_81690 [Comamonadaceae bacterium]|nr:hypothetical protein [Comamonadaceae bacterium]